MKGIKIRHSEEDPYKGEIKNRTSVGTIIGSLELDLKYWIFSIG